MRILRSISALFLGLLLIGVATVPAVAAPAPPGLSAKVLHPRWHRVTGNVNTVVSGGRYLALTTLSNDTSLYDKQTKTRTLLNPPGCLHDHGVDGFGGPWLAFECDGSGGPQVDLFGLATETWTVIPLGPGMCSSGAETICEVFGVGTTWIRFAIRDGFEHGGATAYLQNIATGAVEADPANESGADIQDDLDAPSGIGAPCTDLGASAFSSPYDPGSFPSAFPYWHQFGNYVLTTGVTADEGGGTVDRLYKCGSGLLLRLGRNAFASTQALVRQQTEGSAVPPLDGRYLPTLRSFIVQRPKGKLVAFSNRTLYTLSGAQLWAGTFGS